MSEMKGKIRDMVMALSRDDHEEADALKKEVMGYKSKAIVSEMLDPEDEVDESMMTAGKQQARAARRHHKAGAKDMKAKQKAGKVKGKAPVEEINDTGSDSPVVKGSHDASLDDVTAKKGSVSKSGKIDHKDYKGEKPNLYKKKDAVDGKPVTENKKSDGK
jgi:hypothetical protein